MTRLSSRSEWGARRPTQQIQQLGRVDGLAVHHSGSKSDEHDEHSKCVQSVRSIQAFHTGEKPGERGWSDIAYHFVACRHDVLFVGRGLSQRSAAQGTDDGNAHWVAVCVLGDGGPGFRMRSLGALRAVLQARQLVVHAHPSATAVRPHSAFHATACPGQEVREWLKTRRW